MVIKCMYSLNMIVYEQKIKRRTGQYMKSEIAENGKIRKIATESQLDALAENVRKVHSAEIEFQDFDDIVEDRIEQIRTILSEKGREYATSTDRFHNFRVAARILDTTPECALLGMMIKHIVSVLDLIDSTDELNIEMIDEKIGDTINYLILLEGLLRERV